MDALIHISAARHDAFPRDIPSAEFYILQLFLDCG